MQRSVWSMTTVLYDCNAPAAGQRVHLETVTVMALPVLWSPVSLETPSFLMADDSPVGLCHLLIPAPS